MQLSTLVFTLFTSSFFLLNVINPFPSKQHFHSLFLSLSSNASSFHHLQTLTSKPHPSSSLSDSVAATHVASSLSSSSLSVRYVSYDVYLSFPLARSLNLSSPTLKDKIRFNLVQLPYPNDPYADMEKDVLPTFHAYSKSGSAVGPAVYANYGRVSDFERLRQLSVKVNGSVVIARYGQIYRGDIVKNAEDEGAIGVVVFTDFKDYGGGGLLFPEGRGMPRSGVQVGSTFRGIGDPSTPGWPSGRGELCERVEREEMEWSGMVTGIPSIPVSGEDGVAILKEVGGQVADEDWWGSDGDGREVRYNVGAGPGVVEIRYEGNDAIVTIRNVVGVIEGEEEPDRYVILGNHRDAWTFGAVDPNSGTASLLELAERLGKLQKRGWKPRRTIILCNWDAEEYGLVGSTEWVEENREMLYSRTVAYLNVDSAVSGPGFHVGATPQLDKLIKQAAKQVQDPDNSSQSLYESWASTTGSPQIGRLGGAGTDFAAFVQHIGVPSVNMFFGGGYPVYHSMYDDFVWMQKFGDPLFHRHVAVASIWGLVALKLADDKFLPFDYVDYASELQNITKSLEEEVTGMPVNFSPLYMSIIELKKAATKINNQVKRFGRNSWDLKLMRRDTFRIRELNDRLMMAERAFTDREGLSERPWYKHLIYAPSQHDDYGSKSCPGIDDAIAKAKSQKTSQAWKSVQHEVWRVARVVTQASLVLNGELK